MRTNYVGYKVVTNLDNKYLSATIDPNLCLEYKIGEETKVDLKTYGPMGVFTHHSYAISFVNENKELYDKCNWIILKVKYVRSKYDKFWVDYQHVAEIYRNVLKQDVPRWITQDDLTMKFYRCPPGTSFAKSVTPIEVMV